VNTIQTNEGGIFVTFDHYIGTVKVRPTFSALAGPTITYGQSSVTLGGKITASSTYPPGSVNITLAGVTESAPISTTDGTFSATFDTASLPVGSYTIQYNYAGDTHFQGISGTGTLQVTYGIQPLYNSTKPVHPDATLVIEFQVVDASGNDLSNELSSANVAVTAVSLVGPNGTSTPRGRGNSNPDNLFRQIGDSYQYDLDTAGLTAGTYTLLVRIGNDPVLHTLTFVIE
jgi:hypothetical protein